jgi:hypothetical protein
MAEAAALRSLGRFSTYRRHACVERNQERMGLRREASCSSSAYQMYACVGLRSQALDLQAFQVSIKEGRQVGWPWEGMRVVG